MRSSYAGNSSVFVNLHVEQRYFQPFTRKVTNFYQPRFHEPAEPSSCRLPVQPFRQRAVEAQPDRSVSRTACRIPQQQGHLQGLSW